MGNNDLGKTWYGDLSVKEVYKNFLIKYPAFGIIRWFMLGLFGFTFKMIVRINRAIRDPETAEIKWGYTIMLVTSILIVIALLVFGVIAAMMGWGIILAE